MSDDLRKQIAQALIRERQRRLAGVSMDAALADADAVLAVVRPVIEQAEQELARLQGEYDHFTEVMERVEARAEQAERHHADAQDYITHVEARVATPEAALDVERNYWQTRSHLARTRTEEVMAEYHLDLIGAALGEQDTATCPTCGVSRPIDPGVPERRGTPPPCRDPWHAAPPVEGNP